MTSNPKTLFFSGLTCTCTPPIHSGKGGRLSSSIASCKAALERVHTTTLQRNTVTQRYGYTETYSTTEIATETPQCTETHNAENTSRSRALSHDSTRLMTLTHGRAHSSKLVHACMTLWCTYWPYLLQAKFLDVFHREKRARRSCWHNERHWTYGGWWQLRIFLANTNGCQHYFHRKVILVCHVALDLPHFGLKGSHLLQLQSQCKCGQEYACRQKNEACVFVCLCDCMCAFVYACLRSMKLSISSAYMYLCLRVCMFVYCARIHLHMRNVSAYVLLEWCAFSVCIWLLWKSYFICMLFWISEIQWIGPSSEPSTGVSVRSEDTRASPFIANEIKICFSMIRICEWKT